MKQEEDKQQKEDRAFLGSLERDRDGLLCEVAHFKRLAEERACRVLDLQIEVERLRAQLSEPDPRAMRTRRQREEQEALGGPKERTFMEMSDAARKKKEATSE